jgi:hypothetical protein
VELRGVGLEASSLGTALMPLGAMLSFRLSGVISQGTLSLGLRSACAKLVAQIGAGDQV